MLRVLLANDMDEPCDFLVAERRSLSRAPAWTDTMNPACEQVPDFVPEERFIDFVVRLEWSDRRRDDPAESLSLFHTIRFLSF